MPANINSLSLETVKVRLHNYSDHLMIKSGAHQTAIYYKISGVDNR